MVTVNCIEYAELQGTNAFNEFELLPLTTLNTMIYTELMPSDTICREL